MKRAQLAIVVTFDADVTTKEEAVKSLMAAMCTERPWIKGVITIIEESWIDEKYDRDSWEKEAL